nr:ATP-binding cassette domain-containing protein [Bacillus subtilis]
MFYLPLHAARLSFFYNGNGSKKGVRRRAASRKHQKGIWKKTIVKGISFSLQKGESFGLLGSNGAGKSTTISMISGTLCRMTAGTSRWAAMSSEKKRYQSETKNWHCSAGNCIISDTDGS